MVEPAPDRSASASEARLDARIDARLAAPRARIFRVRWRRYRPELREALLEVYGPRTDELLDRLFELMLDAAAERSGELWGLDEARLITPDWLQQPSMIGYVAYTDRFAGTLQGVRERLDYLEQLGVGYLHLMPLLRPRPGDNDGGYAVQSYREVRPDLGTMADLSALASDLRARGISLVLDLVLNHVAREHEWAERARAGEQKYRDYFHVFPDRTLPDRYEQALPEVFPDFAPGNFTHDEQLGGWVWTTFNEFQWDLNWANPDVFVEMADVILHLANQGVEVFRLDAIAFTWKELGTTCQNLPQVHAITQALRAVARTVAPAVAFKAEAIVGPDDMVRYLGQGRYHGKVSDLAYHNTLMVQAWSALASRDTRLAQQVLGRLPSKPTTTTWADYIRCHDDIGWAIEDADAAAVGLNGFEHRRFLSDFYSGAHAGSFARGLVFQENPATGDRRISGTLASLAGLEAAQQSGDWFSVLDAVHRIELLHALMLGFGGVPLLYMGDEIAMLNDYAYPVDPEHAADNRWVHRPRMDWGVVEGIGRGLESPAAWVNAGIRHQVEVRRQTPHLHASVETRVVESPDPRLLMLRRDHPVGVMLQLYNFSEQKVGVPFGALRDHLGPQARELLAGHDWNLRPESFFMDKYQALWFVAPADA